jgi:transposase InsO family protein
MTETDVECILQVARERFPDEKPRIISDNGPQLIARDSKEYLRISGMTHVRTSPYSPQSNGKLERFHKTITSNKHIAAGQIWAKICTAVLKRSLAHAAQIVGHVMPMSTRRVAMCARHVLDALVAELLAGMAQLAHVLADGLAYLLANARRAHPEHDRSAGRLRAGLVVLHSATWPRR